MFLIYIFKGDVYSECFGYLAKRKYSQRLPDREFITVDGLGGTCITLHLHNATREESENYCKQHFGGELLSHVNKKLVYKMTNITGFSEKFYMWIAFQKGINKCWTMNLRGEIWSRYNCTLRLYFFCQYPFQYQCSFIEHVSNVTPTTNLIPKTTLRTCDAHKNVYWQESDADHKKNCSKTTKEVLVYNMSEQGGFCFCVKEHGWKLWTDWSECSKTCGEVGQGIHSRKRYVADDCDYKYHVQEEQKSCNTHISCFNKSETTRIPKTVSFPANKSWTPSNSHKRINTPGSEDLIGTEIGTISKTASFLANKSWTPTNSLEQISTSRSKDFKGKGVIFASIFFAFLGSFCIIFGTFVWFSRSKVQL